MEPIGMYMKYEKKMKHGLDKHEEIEPDVKRVYIFEKFREKLELDEKTGDEIIEMEIWD